MLLLNCAFRILLNRSKGLGYNEKVRQKCEDMYKEGCRTNHLLACMIDIYQERCPFDETPSPLFHGNFAYEVSPFLQYCAFYNITPLVISDICIYTLAVQGFSEKI